MCEKNANENVWEGIIFNTYMLLKDFFRSDFHNKAIMDLFFYLFNL